MMISKRKFEIVFVVQRNSNQGRCNKVVHVLVVHYSTCYYALPIEGPSKKCQRHVEMCDLHSADTETSLKRTIPEPQTCRGVLQWACKTLKSTLYLSAK